MSCSQEETLSASEFVDRVNEQGVEVQLGEQLHSAEANELYDLELAPLPGLPEQAADEHVDEKGRETGGEHEHGPGAGGTLYVFDDADAATDQVNACRVSAGLVCYRAANVVVLFEEGGIEVQRLGVAIRRLGDE